MALKITATGEQAQPGGKVNISAQGTAPGTDPVQVSLLQGGTTVASGNATVDAQGNWATTFKNVPNASDYDVLATCYSQSDQEPVPFSLV